MHVCVHVKRECLQRTPLFQLGNALLQNLWPFLAFPKHNLDRSLLYTMHRYMCDNTGNATCVHKKNLQHNGSAA